MLQRIKKYIGIAVFVIAATACNKQLDIQPTQSIEETEALKTSTDVEAALIGAYSDLGDADVHGGGFQLISELLAESNEFNWSGTFQGLTQIYNKAIPVNNTFAQATWIDAYQVINDVNNVLGAIDVVLPAKKAGVEAQAKFIRGAVYFELVRLYAKAWNDGNPATNDGVPLVLTPTRAPLTDSNNVPRAKVSEVYAQVIKDLTEAETEFLPATAMLARVYLQQGDYAKAAAAADVVISSGDYNLIPTADVFPFNPDNLSEDVETPEEEFIFGLEVTPTSGTNELNTYFSTLGRGDIDIKEDFLNEFEANDERLSTFYYEDDGTFYTAKHDMAFSTVPVIRIAEMYLIRAEANFRLGAAVGDSPVNDVNAIRERAGLAPLTVAQLTLADILQERRLELAFEGVALHDIKRLQGAVGPLTWNSPKLVLPIPERETKINPNLTQNEGY